MLKKYRDAKKIDRHLYHELYLKCKGNVYKNKRVLMESIHLEKAERQREKNLTEQVMPGSLASTPRCHNPPLPALRPPRDIRGAPCR